MAAGPANPLFNAPPVYTIDAEAGTILLDYSERFTSSEQFNHSF